MVAALAGAALLAACSTTTRSNAGLGSPPAASSAPSPPAPAHGSPAGSPAAPPGTAPGSSPAPLLPRGQVAPVGAVPWSLVGPCWLLALWGPNRGTGAGAPTPAGNVAENQETTTLFLVDPLGGRYQVATLPPPANRSLAGWSGDGRRALLASFNGIEASVTEIDLTTGTPDAQFSVPAPAGGIVQIAGYTRPSGRAVLASTEAGTTDTLERLSLSGAEQQSYPASFPQVGRFLGGALETPDGSEVVMEAAAGLAVAGNGGAVAAQLPVPGGGDCRPARWWSSGVVLASCLGSGSGNRLWEVPVTGAAPSPLTAPPAPPDAGDLDAWQVASTVYVQDAGGCGSAYLARLQPGGTTAPVTVPGVDNADSIHVVGAAGSELALQATISCGGGVGALWFDPAAGTSTVVLGPTVNGGGVIAALGYPDPLG
jgi:hypothetical protein